MVSVGDPNNLPSEAPKPPPTPTELATAAATQLIEQQNEAKKKAFEASIDGIVDPGRPHPSPPQFQKPDEQVRSAVVKPSVIPGAVPDAGITEDLLNRAYAMGIDEEEARQTPANLLERHIERLEDAYYSQPEPPPQPQWQPPPQEYQQFMQWRQQQFQQQPQLLQPVPLPNPADENIIWDDNLVQWSNHMQQVVNQRDQMMGQLAQQVQQLQQQQQQNYQSAQTRQNVEDRQTMDRLFAADKEYKDVIGEGGFHDVEGTRHQSIRHEVGIRMQSIIDEAQRYGSSIPVESAYRQAMHSLFGPRAQQQAVGEIAERLRNRAGQFVARPTATTRTNELPHGVERAEIAVGQMLAEQRKRQ